MKKCLGIIGCGSVVQTMYVQVIPGWQDIDKIYVYDVDALQSEKVSLKLNATLSGIENLIEKSDIIIIASPPHTHYELLKQSIQKGKTVICEKPFLYNFSEAKEVISLAQNIGCELFVAHMRRIFPSIALGKQIIESGILGEIKEIELFEGGRFAYVTSSGYETNNKYGGVLLDTGSHTLDSALFVLGLDDAEIDIENINISKDKPEPAHEILSIFHIATSGKMLPVKLSLSRKTALSNKINIIAENGILEIPLGMSDNIRLSKRGKPAFVAEAAYNLESYAQALALEYNTIFDKNKNHIFRAERFLNLTSILEKLLIA